MTSAPPPDPDRTNQADPAEAPLGSGFRLDDPASPLAPYYLRVSHVLACLFVAVLLLVYSRAPVWHTDFWGHLAFGKWMVTHRQLPERELFSPFADRAAPYFHYQWLTQAGAYLLYHTGEILAGGDAYQQMTGGLVMIQTAHGLLLALRYVLLLLALHRLTGSLPLALAGTVLYFLLMASPGRVQRPQVVGELFFAGLLLALSRPVLSARALVGVPLLLVVWANGHGSFLVGLMLLGVFFLGRCLDVWRDQAGWRPLAPLEDPQARRLLLALLCSVLLTALLNPHGPRLYAAALALSRSPNVRLLAEWQPLEFTAGPGGHWGYLATLLLLLAAQLVSPRPFSSTQLLLIVTFGAFPCLQQRMMSWWALLVPWLVLPLLAALGERLPWGWLHYRSVPSLGKTLLVGLVAVLSLLWLPPVRWLTAGRPRGTLEQAASAGTPWRLAAQLNGTQGAWGQGGQPLPRLAQALEEHYPGGRFRGAVLASETLGDYLIWALPREMPVAVYTHAHLFPEGHWDRSMRAKHGEPGWEDALDRMGVNLVLIEPALHPRLAERLRQDPEWVVVLDEGGLTAKPDPRTRLLAAVRKTPLEEPSPEGGPS